MCNTKQCNKCGETKPLTDFYKHKGMKDGHLNTCKVCQNKITTRNLLKRRATDPEFKARHNAQMKAGDKKRMENPEYKKKRYEHTDAWKKNKKATCMEHRLWENLYNLTMYTIKNTPLKGKVKISKNKEIVHLGCSMKEYLEHLESTWFEGCTWDNYGTYWEIDHIIPRTAFEYKQEQDMYVAFHYKNTRALCPRENKSKGGAKRMKK